MAVWLHGMGKDTSAVCMYITISEHNKLSDKTLTAKRTQTNLGFPCHKNENQFDVKIFLKALL